MGNSTNSKRKTTPMNNVKIDSDTLIMGYMRNYFNKYTPINLIYIIISYHITLFDVYNQTQLKNPIKKHVITFFIGL